jgi:hypothetical protein
MRRLSRQRRRWRKRPAREDVVNAGAQMIGRRFDRGEKTRYVILRDDDTNVLTPPECLDRLYRPFLDFGLPVNLATIPAVSPHVKRPDGLPERFLWGADSISEPFLPLTRNSDLARYLRQNRGYHMVQHGCHHEPFEFDRKDRSEVVAHLENGRRLLEEAGFASPETFVAPHDKFSRISYVEAARRFRVLSTGWFEMARVPRLWWPHYLVSKARSRQHWRVGNTVLLSHPGCLLSYMRPYESMLASVKEQIQRHRLTILVTHWWEYFPENRADEEFIDVLHKVADYLRGEREIKVLKFSELRGNEVPLN